MSEISFKKLKQHFKDSSDIELRPIQIGSTDITVYLFCIDGLTDSRLLDESILRPMAVNSKLNSCKTEQECFDAMLSGSAYHAFAKSADTQEDLTLLVLNGMSAIIFDGLKKAILFDVRSFDKRSVAEPENETTIKGAKDCFVESLRTNTSLIRRRIHSPNLVIEQKTMGRVSQTDVAIIYISDIADEMLVKRVKNQLEDIDLDNLAAPSFIESFIKPNQFTIFPQVMSSQRPDRIASNLSDGRVCIIVDGFPLVYMLPTQLVSLMQSPEDYSQNYITDSILRAIRFLCLIISLLLPALYIAVTGFHSEILPLEIAVSIQNAKELVPFSSFIETLGLLLSFEIIVEAGTRLSRTAGQAISIVGALVVGQAVVDANLVSTTVVIIVAVTAISGFTIPSQDLANAVRITRFFIAVSASISGFFGMVSGVIFLLIHLCSLENYGVAYLSPLVDIKKRKYHDTIFRLPINKFKFRPDNLASKNHRKQR